MMEEMRSWTELQSQQLTSIPAPDAGLESISGMEESIVSTGVSFVMESRVEIGVDMVDTGMETGRLSTAVELVDSDQLEIDVSLQRKETSTTTADAELGQCKEKFNRSLHTF